MSSDNCFHCGQPIPLGLKLTAYIDGKEQSMCCIGCQAVAQFLADNHHQQFYQYRQQDKPTTAINKTEDYGSIEVAQQDLITVLDNGLSQTSIRVDGMYCSACAWLLQKVLGQLPGIHDIHINTISHKVQVTFLSEELTLQRIYQTISQLGYQPKPDRQKQKTDHGHFLKKLMASGFGMMFIMTISVPLYTDTLTVTDPLLRRFFVLLSLLVATWVYFYSGKVFVFNAWRDLKNRHLGMDVPVATSISLAYFASVYLSFNGQGHVYFDSMSMFIFFLLLGRFIENQVKQQHLDIQSALLDLIPISAKREVTLGIEEVPLKELKKGDILVLSAGETIAADGLIVAGHGQCNEAILTGEARPVRKMMGQRVYAGAQLIKGDIKVQISCDNDDSLLSQMAQMMERSQQQKPRQWQLADHIASYFVAVVLVLALVTLLTHWWLDTGLMMVALLSVLIATCPCALSLATPTALTAAAMNLIKHGVLINQMEAITTLHQVKSWFFDKTGTLTGSEMQVVKTHDLRKGGSQRTLPLNIITAYLQKVSSHPIASAFPSVLIDQDYGEVKEFPGYGVAGHYKKVFYRLGSDEWMRSFGYSIPDVPSDNTLVYLANDQGILAVFELTAQLREGATELCATLQEQHKSLQIVSGDHKQAVQNCAEQLHIKNWYAACKADDKKQLIMEQNEPVVMVGDGVNDAPVLAMADVSISLKQGAPLAHAASDLVILGQSLKPIMHALRVSAFTQRIIKVNLVWALLYNMSITPIAMMGMLSPWLAAIGMSVSSLLVVLNSRRVVGVKS